MNKISTGEPSTLAIYRKIAVALGGENTDATKFFDAKIAQSLNGENEEVIVDERQVLNLIANLLGLCNDKDH